MEYSKDRIDRLRVAIAADQHKATGKSEWVWANEDQHFGINANNSGMRNSVRTEVSM